VLFKITAGLRAEVLRSLMRPHLFAAERVAFLKCRVGLAGSTVVVLAGDLHHVEDEDYVDDPSAGATMGPAAIRKALQVAYRERVSMFHVHIHGHEGTPRFSRTDFHESAIFVPDFWNVQPDLPHGAIVLSFNSAWGRCWHPDHAEPIDIDYFAFVGSPLRCTWKR
jgi:hypothetical protein